MTDRPILMAGPDVRAILREIDEPGTGKAMLRRPVGVKRYAASLRGYSSTGRVLAYAGDHRLGLEFVDDVFGLWDATANPDGRSAWYVPLPFAIGDRLWVRETWRASDDGIDVGRLRPSIHMPRRAARLTLVVTEIKVERLQDISEADARAEGVEPILAPPDGGSAPYIEGFRSLWDSINGLNAWDKNPWVAAVRFVPHLRNIDAMDRDEP